jgi:bacillithiol system protein YtxJ
MPGPSSCVSFENTGTSNGSRCGVSCEALDELHAHIGAAAVGDIVYKMITVQTHRAVSDVAAQRLGIRHETPQAILVRDGKVIWNASHFGITATRLDQVVSGA